MDYYKLINDYTDLMRAQDLVPATDLATIMAQNSGILKATLVYVIATNPNALEHIQHMTELYKRKLANDI